MQCWQWNSAWQRCCNQAAAAVQPGTGCGGGNHGNKAAQPSQSEKEAEKHEKGEGLAHEKGEGLMGEDKMRNVLEI